MTTEHCCWAVIGWDAETGVTIERTGNNPEALADHCASWAQQEADRWPEMGLLYMIVRRDELPDEQP